MKQRDKTDPERDRQTDRQTGRDHIIYKSEFDRPSKMGSCVKEREPDIERETYRDEDRM